MALPSGPLPSGSPQRIANGWLSARDLQPQAAMRLFCLPHAGSGAALFYRWKRLLPTLDVCPVLLPGREMRLAEPSLRDAARLVAELDQATRPWLDTAFAIFGHSMGSLLAYEWARRLALEGAQQPRCLFVSGRNAPHRPFGHRELHRLGDEEFVAELGRRYGGMAGELLEDRELRDVFLPILRADLEVVETYRAASERVLSCDIVAFAGADDASVSDAGLDAWGELTTGSFECHRIAGDHFFHSDAGQAQLLSILAKRCDDVT